MRKVLAALLAALICAPFVMASPGKSGKTFSVDQTDIHYGDTVTFSWTGYNASYITIECFKRDASGEPIASERVYWASEPATSAFTLTGWDGSPVVCLAGLYGKSGVGRAVTRFDVEA